jgi:hypothetical protein
MCATVPTASATLNMLLLSIRYGVAACPQIRLAVRTAAQSALLDTKQIEGRPEHKS